jgi:hypothetical protein
MNFMQYCNIKLPLQNSKNVELQNFILYNRLHQGGSNEKNYYHNIGNISLNFYLKH